MFSERKPYSPYTVHSAANSNAQKGQVLRVENHVMLYEFLQIIHNDHIVVNA